MAKFKIIKPINWGPATIGDKNYGPQCPSCKVSINNYAPKVGDTVEGDLITGKYYDFSGPQKQIKTGTGILFEIKTNGDASTQGQRSVQFITEDHLQAEPIVTPEEPTPPVGSPANPELPGVVGKTACWICENWIPALIFLVLAIALFAALNGD